MVLSSARALVTGGMAAAGWQYVLIDDCWAATTRDAQGRLQGDPDRFPHGMAALVGEVHALGASTAALGTCREEVNHCPRTGLKLGLYTSVGPTTCRRVMISARVGACART